MTAGWPRSPHSSRTGPLDTSINLSARQAASFVSSKELELEEDWCFVFGGDASDKGPGTLRVVMALVALKKRHGSTERPLQPDELLRLR